MTVCASENRAHPPIEFRRTAIAAFDLGEGNYRRSEDDWSEAGRPTARVTLSATGNELTVDVDVATGDLVLVPGVRRIRTTTSIPTSTDTACSCTSGRLFDAGAWMIVPEAGSAAARVRAIEGWGTLQAAQCDLGENDSGILGSRSRRTPAAARGISARDVSFSIDVLVNETAPGRERRRGQLVLSGGRGEFVYLRGDRHDPSRLVGLVIRD